MTAGTKPGVARIPFRGGSTASLHPSISLLAQRPILGQVLGQAWGTRLGPLAQRQMRARAEDAGGSLPDAGLVAPGHGAGELASARQIFSTSSSPSPFALKIDSQIPGDAFCWKTETKPAHACLQKGL